MNFNQLPSELQAKILETLKEHYSDINPENIKISKTEGSKLKISYGDLMFEIPIKTPDQATSNSIASMIVGGALALVSVAFGFWIRGKDKS